MFNTKNVLMKNIVTIAKEMNYEETPLVFTGSEYYFTWTDKTEDDVKEIYDKTGIKCRLGENGTLLVPIYNNFKSEKEKDLLMKFSQYGNTMMYLELCKKSKPDDLRMICKELFRIVANSNNEEDFSKIIETIINKIS